MAQKEKTLVQVLIDGISAIFLPIVNLLSAAGILKGVLAILTATAVLSTKSETYIVLNAMGDSLFYFLPVMLAYTSANKFGVNPFTAVVISGILLYPDLTQLMEKGNTVHFLGLGLRGVTYHSSVIPIIMATGFLYLVEKALEKVIPELIKGFMIPLISIIVVGFVTLAVFGPIGAVIGDVLAAAYENVYGLSPLIAGLLLGAVIQPMVIFGFHWSFILIAMNNITVSGRICSDAKEQKWSISFRMCFSSFICTVWNYRTCNVWSESSKKKTDDSSMHRRRDRWNDRRGFKSKCIVFCFS